MGSMGFFVFKGKLRKAITGNYWKNSHVRPQYIFIITPDQKFNKKFEMISISELKSFGIDSITGFLPNPSPIEKLPPEYKLWDDLVLLRPGSQHREAVQKVSIFYNVVAYIIH